MQGKCELALELGYQSRSTFWRHVKLLLERNTAPFTWADYSQKRLLPDSWANWIKNKLS